MGVSGKGDLPPPAGGQPSPTGCRIPRGYPVSGLVTVLPAGLLPGPSARPPHVAGEEGQTLAPGWLQSRSG